MNVAANPRLTAIGQALAQKVTDETKLTTEQKALVGDASRYVSISHDQASGVCLVDHGNRIPGKVVAEAFVAAMKEQGRATIVVNNLRQMIVAKSPQELFTDGYKNYTAELNAKVSDIISPATLASIRSAAGFESAIQPSDLAKGVAAELARRNIDNPWVKRNLEWFMSPALLKDPKFDGFLTGKFPNPQDAIPALASMLVDAATFAGDSLEEQFFTTFIGKLPSGQTLHEAAVDVLRSSGVVSEDTLTHLAAGNSELAAQALKSDAVFAEQAKSFSERSRLKKGDDIEGLFRDAGSPAIRLMHAFASAISSDQG